MIKEKGVPMENNEPKRFSLLSNKISNGLNYYAESLMNLDYSNIIKLELSLEKTNLGRRVVTQVRQQH